jgi:hypothetical protein
MLVNPGLMSLPIHKIKINKPKSQLLEQLAFWLD